MSAHKISLSLQESDLAFLDGETLEGRYPSRSAVVQDAIRVLRESRLADAYAEAFGEWDDSGDAALWESTAADGLESAGGSGTGAA
ncbi:ribbon-helix-helix domain-containing protein [Herbiconiux sp. KACC 21604]|uniref:ribbon-helix-helix domain-containing protein n=1 Tax=unclassified Herbiconiux TaxID=2618217 RepID=UPI0014921556|nr:ribbon-helix-helix domain-containing protein [Herbiconiux sp. SALV-R1]QJU54834.1 antitoxin [Herbiconiux sp. SALV-R1]WPO85951.1 ribbon-helix-helix domain-containing protein [Herbiconiux sp. KACC 21604]